MHKYEYDPSIIDAINTEVDLFSLMVDHFGYEPEPQGKNRKFFCPWHVDKTASLNCDTEKNVYHCFSCGCSGNVLKFLMEFEGMRFSEAVEYAARIAGIDTNHIIVKSQTLAINRKLKIEADRAKAKNIKVEHEILPLSELDRYAKEYPQEWIDEGISTEIMELHNIRIDKRRNNIVYPVWSADDKLIGIKSRTRFEDYKARNIPKYMHYYSIGAMDYLQGLQVARDSIMRTKRVTVFESLKSVMKLQTWGVFNTVSAETHVLSTEQIKILLKMGVKDILVAWDSDVSYGDKGIKKNLDILKRFMNTYIIVDREGVLGGKEGKNAPVDLGEEVWRKLAIKKYT